MHNTSKQDKSWNQQRKCSEGVGFGKTRETKKLNNKIGCKNKLYLVLNVSLFQEAFSIVNWRRRRLSRLHQLPIPVDCICFHPNICNGLTAASDRLSWFPAVPACCGDSGHHHLLTHGADAAVRGAHCHHQRGPWHHRQRSAVCPCSCCCYWSHQSLKWGLLFLFQSDHSHRLQMSRGRTGALPALFREGTGLKIKRFT